MVDVTTSAASAASLPTNDRAIEAPALSSEQNCRRRVLELRDAIERGEYCVSAPELADAILRTARRAN